MSTSGRASSSELVSRRLLGNFTCLGIESPSKDSVRSIFKVYSELIVLRWTSEVQSQAGKICDVFVDLYDKIHSQENLFKPTPAHSHCHYNWTDLFKICAGLILVETSYLKDRESLIKLIYHEVLRVFCDKQEQADKLSSSLRDLCLYRFSFQKGSSPNPGSLPRDLYFSVYSPDVEGFYTEID